MKGSFILLNKEKGISSNKIDNKVKKALYFSKVGHLGTLDPDATGLLVLMTDRATKCAKYFDSMDKVYEMTILFGATSKSLDLDSEITDSIDIDLRGKEKEIDEVIHSFKGIISQKPPIYSAIKIDGVALYKYAHKGEEIDIPKREVTLYNIERISPITYLKPYSYVTIKAHVSKGFYMRSLAYDIGEKLGIPSMSKSINRLREGEFNLDDASTLDEIINGKYNPIDPIEYMDFPKIEVNDQIYTDILNGKWLVLDNISEYIKIYHNSEFVAIYKFDKDTNTYRMDFLA